MKKILFLALVTFSCGGSSSDTVENITEETTTTQQETTTTQQETTTTQQETTTTVQPDAVLSNISNMNTRGVSPHMEIVDSSIIRIFYSSLDVMGLAVDLCDYELNCTRQGVVNRVQAVSYTHLTLPTIYSV